MKINLAEILKNCPADIKLYSTTYGEVIFKKVISTGAYPIICYNEYTFTAYGHHFSDEDGECVLFPSKNQHDWSKFSIFKDGDILSDGTNIFIFNGKYFKGHPCAYCGINYVNKFIIVDETNYWTNSNVKLATDNETLTLFSKMEKVGYMWNADTKKLVSLIKEGDAVMVADTPDFWAVRHYFENNLTKECNCGAIPWSYIVPIHKFIFTGNIQENIKHSIIL